MLMGSFIPAAFEASSEPMGYRGHGTTPAQPCKGTAHRLSLSVAPCINMGASNARLRDTAIAGVNSRAIRLV